MQQKRKNISNFLRLLHRLETSCSASEATHKEAGFTLIEVIVTMLIAGIVATIAGLGIVQGVKGYVFASENAAITQKAELAMARISLELRDASEVAGTDTTITYIRDSSNHTIAYNGGEKIIDGNGNTLINRVSSLKLTYYYKESDTATELTEMPNNPTINDLVARIDIVLKLKHTETEDEDISDITFTTTINPRNTF